MGLGTSIEWTDMSWPVVNGCRRISAGCENCYAERLSATRLSRTPKYKGLAIMGPHGPRWTGDIRLWEPHLALPLTMRKPKRIFVADMGDLFYERVPYEDIAAVFGVMAACPQHEFQVLTKRPRRMRDWFQWLAAYRPAHQREIAGAFASNIIEGIDVPGGDWPLPNVWLGVSVEDQSTADERIPILLKTPAALRFVSYEPALGPVEFSQYVKRFCGCPQAAEPSPCDDWSDGKGCRFEPSRLDWVIVGGESGPRARPFDVEWARSTILACRAAGVPAFVKQLGAHPVSVSPEVFGRGRARIASAGEIRTDGTVLAFDLWAYETRDAKGGDIEEWPEDLRVREFPRTAPAVEALRKAAAL